MYETKPCIACRAGSFLIGVRIGCRAGSFTEFGQIGIQDRQSVSLLLYSVSWTQKKTPDDTGASICVIYRAVMPVWHRSRACDSTRTGLGTS